MSFMGAGVASGPGALRFGAMTRGRIQGGSSYGVNYPHPFFDVAQTYLPVTYKQLFKWTRHYFLTQGHINATTFKFAEYPVTDLLIDHENAEVKAHWEEFLKDTLRYRSFQVEVGLDYFTYGNAFVGISFPFFKYLRCQSCGATGQARQWRKHWIFTNHAFRLTCPKCGHTGDAAVKDFYVKNASGIRLVRWNPEDIEITNNEITGESTYFYNIPGTIRNDITIGKKDIVEALPQIFIQALKEGKGIIFSKDILFHLRRPGISNQDKGWGLPLLMPVLKDSFYLQLMKKAHEAVLLEHIVPLRVLFPQAGSGSSDPYTTVNLSEWREHVATEIARWRYDNNYIPIMPLPIGQQTIGGDGRALLMHAEMQMVIESIINGMGAPRELVFGGMSYAGTNVSMRMVENSFLGYLTNHYLLLRFVMDSTASYMEWPRAKGRFKPFKMADDLQRIALIAQLNQQGKVSDTTMLSAMDLNQDEENKIMMRESESRIQAQKKQQLAQAEMQGKMQEIMMNYQMKAQQAAQQAAMAQQAPGEPGGPEQSMAGTLGGQPVGPGDQAQNALVMGQPQNPQPGSVDGSAAGVPAEMQSPVNAGQQAPPNGQVDPVSFAWAQAKVLSSLPPDQQQQAIQALAAQSPELAQLVQQMLSQMLGQQQQPQGPAVDTRPLPEQLPPRRQTPSI